MSLNVPSYSLIERDREKRFLGIGAGISEAQVQASLKTLQGQTVAIGQTDSLTLEEGERGSEVIKGLVYG